MKSEFVNARKKLAFKVYNQIRLVYYQIGTESSF